MEVSTKDQTCKICEKVFSNKSKLNMHTKVAHKEKILSKEKSQTCSLCGKSLKSKQALDYHISSVHEGKKPHKCNDCEKNYFSSKSSLKVCTY